MKHKSHARPTIHRRDRMKYVYAEKLPSGHVRYRFERLGQKVTLSGEFRSPQFMKEYYALLDGVDMSNLKNPKTIEFIQMTGRDEIARVRKINAKERRRKKEAEEARRAHHRKQNKALRAMVYNRDGHKCHYCSDNVGLTLDHIVARSCGGSNEPDNLLTACRACNSAKGSRSYQWYTDYCRARGYVGEYLKSDITEMAV